MNSIFALYYVSGMIYYFYPSNKMKKKYPIQLKQFGEKIKELRNTEELTQYQLAKKCSIDTRTIQRIEAGEIAAGLHVVFSLAQAFDISVSKLLENITFAKKPK
ncbi:MAG TPA: helix-turn-helix transcriptional regulator [Bacteroidia bacterium]|jgi:DNA-binding XRE family transcriptional regulator|nr:helix-turn-helix transcriptional regulator [Bacteroidia bacterium]